MRGREPRIFFTFPFKTLILKLMNKLTPKDLEQMNIEKFKAVGPSEKYADQMTDFVNELRRENYSSRSANPWLKDVEVEFSRHPDGSEKLKDLKLLVRTNDDHVVGLYCVRDDMDEQTLLDFGGNISYLIRPSERRKGYNKINMYLALKECAKRGFSVITLVVEAGNRAASRSVRAMGGNMVTTFFDRDGMGLKFEKYIVNVKDAIASYAPIFEYLIEE